MLSIITFIELAAVFVKSKCLRSVRKKMCSMSIILSLFFFSSSDPIVGMPLYIYPLLLSVACSLICHPKVKKQSCLVLVVLLISMILPLIVMESNIGSEKYMLIKESTTDTLYLNNQLIAPNVNFTVIKHFAFMLVYVLFVVVNADIFKDAAYIQNLINGIVNLFKLLIVGIIVEWGIVNILGGINDRQLMGSIFSLKTINQMMNWYTWGSYSVALWFTERSNFNIVAIFYMIYLKKRDIRPSEWIWIVLSVVAIYCTGSSSCLAILGAFLVVETYIVVVRNRKISQFIFMGVIAAGCLVVFLNNIELFSNKIYLFLQRKETWNSGYFRANSITYGIEAIKNHIFFGVGIGTVYVHSMLVQTLANIGMVGTFLMLWLHGRMCPIKRSLTNVCASVFIVCISCGCYMVQNFTSPFLIIIFIVLSCNEEALYGNQNSKSNSLLLVRQRAVA